jgi:tRNA 5-methylaminomethyl-2-thiouridine biosynthesis bifunctional protein
MSGIPDPIVPAPVSIRDGALYSAQFGDVYHSIEGGIEETRHVFLAGNELPPRWRRGGAFTIVETGFGSGLNFLATWQAFRDSAPGSARLHYVAVEKHPFRLPDLQRVHATWPQFQAISDALLDAYPPLMPGFHRLHFEGGRVGLTLLFGDALEQLAELDASADAFFLDGFAPARNPQMWRPALCAQLARLAAPGATAATYSVAGTVKRSLTEAGFSVIKRPGYAKKREMLVARFPGRWRVAAPPVSRVTVIGAGIAGTSCALALARAGVEVELFERAPRPASATSSNPAGLVRPFVSLEQGTRNRFTLSAFAYATRHYAALARVSDALWSGSGVLQLARDEAHGAKLQRALSQHALPAELARWVGGQEAAAMCGAQPAGPGVWFENAGWLRGTAACDAALRAAGGRVSLRSSMQVTNVERMGDALMLSGADGNPLVSAEHVVLANGHHAAGFSVCAGIELRPVRGQLTLIPARATALRAPVCQEGYVTPAIDGWHVAGGTFEEGEAGTHSTCEDDAANIARARRMLPGLFDGLTTASLQSWVGVRCVSRDRRPLLGPLVPGVFGILALGSRGFTWAPLASELIAAQVTGAPLPIERSVAAGLAPARRA